LTLADVQRETRIRVRYLQGLEDERFDLLPGEAYVKGFLRSYADFLGLESRLYLDEYAERYAHAEEPELVPRPTARLRRRRIPRAMVVLLALCVGGAVVAWRVDGSHGKRPAAAPAADKTPKVKLVVNAAVPPSVEPLTPHTAVLRLSAVGGDCWLAVHVGSANGKRVWIGFLRRGQTIRFGLRHRLWVRFGNPDVLAVRLNGKPVGNLPHAAASVLVDATGWHSG
jgi:hypothetical protein